MPQIVRHVRSQEVHVPPLKRGEAWAESAFQHGDDLRPWEALNGLSANGTQRAVMTKLVAQDAGEHHAAVAALTTVSQRRAVRPHLVSPAISPEAPNAPNTEPLPFLAVGRRFAA